MCCQGMRILVLFGLTALSFLANYFYSNVQVVLWYALFINTFTCTVFFVDGVRIKKSKEPFPTSNLLYFSIVGGVFGGIVATLLAGVPRKQRWFLGTLLLICVIWIAILIYMYRNYEPFWTLFL